MFVIGLAGLPSDRCDSLTGVVCLTYDHVGFEDGESIIDLQIFRLEGDTGSDTEDSHTGCNNIEDIDRVPGETPKRR